MMGDASTMEAGGEIPEKRKQRFTCGAHNYVLEYIANTNLFVLCCVAACFSLISYLAAFSCEMSWILEAHGNLPTTAYLLCSGYFILFIASAILIHGLATGLPWGLLSWSVIIGVLGIPELCLVMMITTQFWGLQSTQGLTELVSYIVRLIINCLALLCVIPTALRWRREQEVLKQLQGLATRLKQQTPPPSAHTHSSTISHTDVTASRRRRNSGQDNPAFIVHESQLPFPYLYGVYGSQNEFNASIFGLDPSQIVGPMPPPQFNPSRTRSLLDLRNVVHPPQMALQRPAMIPSTVPQNGHNGANNNEPSDRHSEMGDPIYCTIESDKDYKPTPLMRNCVSLENLGGITIKNDLTTPEQHHKNALTMQQHPHSRNYNPGVMHKLQSHSVFPYQWHPSMMHPYDYWRWSQCVNQHGELVPNGRLINYVYPNGAHQGRRSNDNSKQSLVSDDYRKYRDVAL